MVHPFPSSSSICFTGWLVSYLKSDGTRPNFIFEGLLNRKAATPSKFLISSSSESELSVVWLATFGQLEVKKTVRLGIQDLYFTTSVVVKNIGSAAVTDFYCKH